MLSSGFYWYELGAISGVSGRVDDQYTSIDAIHASLLFVFGLLGVISGFKVAFPASTVTTIVALFIVAAGLSAEIAIMFILYPCSTFAATLQSTQRYFSTTQFILCIPPDSSGLPVGPAFAYCTMIIPLATSWLAFFAMTFTLVAWAKIDEFYFV
jgi:hypothetical protein